ncbi:Endoplasmic reticulum metallopeptidase 1, partial [Mucuna pruriens]
MFSAVSKVGSAAANVASSLHLPGTAKKETGFSEDQAFNHIKAITQISSSAQQTPLFQFVLDESESIKKTAKGEVKVEVDRVPAKHGDSVVLRVLPKYASEAKEHNDILVSAHIDTTKMVLLFGAKDDVYNREGAGDDSSSVAVMLELARGLSQSASGLKHAVIFLFNTGEDEGLNGSHSFITQVSNYFSIYISFN